MSEIIFNKIQKGNIFVSDFQNFLKNNKINFENKKIVVVYAPNGVGKTSLSKVLNSEDGTSFEVIYNDEIFNENSNELFHIISDQNSRNIIQGDTEEFLLGDNIRKEFELKREIDNVFKECFSKGLPKRLKEEFYISKKSSFLIEQLDDEKLKEYVSDIANSTSRGKKIDIKDFCEKIETLEKMSVTEYEEGKLQFFIEDVDKADSIIFRIKNIVENEFRKNPRIEEIEENTVAIEILNKYHNKDYCIVCDNHELPERLLENKIKNKENVKKELNELEKYILDEIIDKMSNDDPFKIKECLTNVIKNGDKRLLDGLVEEFDFYKGIYNILINNLFAKDLISESIIKKVKTYYQMINNKPEFSDEDILYIKEIISSNIDKKITIERDKNNILKLMLDNNEFIGVERETLNLSTGEQNFISLTFELLKAKNNSRPIIVLDDPISSFDSIYKNKIVYSIIKFLENKNQIILTHNTDLIRLLEAQKKKCFKLYLLNNIEGQENGFVEITDKEMNIMIFIPELLDFIRSEIDPFIIDEKKYIISLIPFMRGYAKFIGNSVIKNELTKIMHGYSNERVNVTNIYNTLFNKNISTVYEIDVNDILNLDINNIKILSDDYPILNKTLKHSLIYLYLRLLVENKLVNKYKINVKKYDNLGAIILNAYAGRGNDEIMKKVFLTSKKTLLNEFNHFEGNMSIFQPAIDISDVTLEKEKSEIIDFISKE